MQKSKTRPNVVFSLRFIIKKRVANKEDAVNGSQIKRYASKCVTYDEKCVDTRRKSRKMR
jgi:hypothetical protein